MENKKWFVAYKIEPFGFIKIVEVKEDESFLINDSLFWSGFYGKFEASNKEEARKIAKEKLST